MRPTTKNAYPHLSRSLRAISAVAAIGLLGSACTVVDSVPAPLPTEVSVPAYSNNDVTASERGLIGEVKTSAMCLSSKVLDLSRERNVHPGMTVSEDAVGTTFSINMKVPASSDVTGESIVVHISSIMGIGSNGNGDPAKVTETSVVVYGNQDKIALNQEEPLSLVNILQVEDRPSWRVFMGVQNQPAPEIYATSPRDVTVTNPNVQILTSNTLQEASERANATIDAIYQSVPPVCI